MTRDLLVLADSLEGGLGAAALAQCRWFQSHGWSVSLAAPGAAALVPAGVTPIHYPLPATAFDVAAMLFCARRVRAQLRRRHRAGVVHAHGTRSQLLALLAGRRPFVTIHGGGRIRGQGAVGSAVRGLARRIAAVPAVQAYSVAPTGGRWRTLVHASPRLANLDSIDFPSPDSPPTFVWIGRLDAPKRADVFVRACALAARERPVRGVVMGDGPQLEELRRLAADLDAPVELPGGSDDISEPLSRAWAFCLVSDFEGVPFALQEAMWVGRGAILSPLPTLQWFAGDAALYASGIAEVARAMIALSDHGDARSLAAVASSRVRGLVSAEAPFPQLMREYGAFLRVTAAEEF